MRALFFFSFSVRFRVAETKSNTLLLRKSIFHLMSGIDFIKRNTICTQRTKPSTKVVRKHKKRTKQVNVGCTHVTTSKHITLLKLVSGLIGSVLKFLFFYFVSSPCLYGPNPTCPVEAFILRKNEASLEEKWSSIGDSQKISSQ